MKNMSLLVTGTPDRQAGFSMIEVLVTLVIVAAGIMSFAYMQGQSLRFVTDANSRTQASMFAADITDRMRVNPTIADQYAAPDPEGVCDPMGIAVTDELNCWYRSLAAALPNGNGTIIDDGGGRYTVQVSWRELSSGVTDASAAKGLQRTVSWTVDIQ